MAKTCIAWYSPCQSSHLNLLYNEKMNDEAQQKPLFTLTIQKADKSVSLYISDLDPDLISIYVL